MDITKIDSNLSYTTFENERDYDFYPAFLPPFKLTKSSVNDRIYYL